MTAPAELRRRFVDSPHCRLRFLKRQIILYLFVCLSPRISLHVGPVSYAFCLSNDRKRPTPVPRPLFISDTQITRGLANAELLRCPCTLIYLIPTRPSHSWHNLFRSLLVSSFHPTPARVPAISFLNKRKKLCAHQKNR